jgi:hypothetical protein
MFSKIFTSPVKKFIEKHSKTAPSPFDGFPPVMIPMFLEI